MTDDPAATAHPAIHGVPCAACEAPNAAFLLPSGAPVCGDCYLALANPELPTAPERSNER